MDSIIQGAILVAIVFAIIKGVYWYFSHKIAVHLTTKVSSKEPSEVSSKEPSEVSSKERSKPINQETNLLDMMNVTIKKSLYPFGFGNYGQYKAFFFCGYFLELADELPAEVEKVRNTLKRYSPKMVARVESPFIECLIPEDSLILDEVENGIEKSGNKYEISFNNKKAIIDVFVYNYLKERYPNSSLYRTKNYGRLCFRENDTIRAIAFDQNLLDEEIDIIVERPNANDKSNSYYSAKLYKKVNTLSELKSLSKDRPVILFACKYDETKQKSRYSDLYPLVNLLAEEYGVRICETVIGAFRSSELNRYLRDSNIKKNGVLAFKEGDILEYKEFKSSSTAKEFEATRTVLTRVFGNKLLPKGMITEVDDLLELSHKQRVLCFVDEYRTEWSAIFGFTSLKECYSPILKTKAEPNCIATCWAFSQKRKDKAETIGKFLARQGFPSKGIFGLNNGKVISHKKYKIFSNEKSVEQVLNELIQL